MDTEIVYYKLNQLEERQNEILNDLREEHNLLRNQIKNLEQMHEIIENYIDVEFNSLSHAQETFDKKDLKILHYNIINRIKEITKGYKFENVSDIYDFKLKQFEKDM